MLALAVYDCRAYMCLEKKLRAAVKNKNKGEGVQFVNIFLQGKTKFDSSWKEQLKLVFCCESLPELPVFIECRGCPRWQLPQPGLKVVALVMLFWKQPVAGKKKSYSLHKMTKHWQGCLWSCIASFYSKSSLCLPGCLLVCIFFL